MSVVLSELATDEILDFHRSHKMKLTNFICGTPYQNHSGNLEYENSATGRASKDYEKVPWTGCNLRRKLSESESAASKDLLRSLRSTTNLTESTWQLRAGLESLGKRVKMVKKSDRSVRRYLLSAIVSFLLLVN